MSIANGRGISDSVQSALEALCRAPWFDTSQFIAFRQFYNQLLPQPRLFCNSNNITHESGMVNPNNSIIDVEHIALSTHESVVQAVNKLRCSPEITARTFWTEAFPHSDEQSQKYGTRQIVKLSYLIDPASNDGYPNGFMFENEPAYPVKWQPDQTFQHFFSTAFPIDSQNVWAASNKSSSLKAWKLCRRLKLKIVRTNDLAQHLVYNPATKSLAVFHQIEWLRAQITYTKNRELHEAPEASLAAGTLPPQLLVETLYTIHAVLFPIGTNKKSLKLAKRLVQPDKGFDPKLLVYERPDRELPANFEYKYWSRRLKALQALVDARPPKNRIVSWIERHTSERNALTVAIIGLFLSVLFGFLSVVVGIFQVVVSTWAWKYPVKGSID